MVARGEFHRGYIGVVKDVGDEADQFSGAGSGAVGHRVFDDADGCRVVLGKIAARAGVDDELFPPFPA